MAVALEVDETGGCRVLGCAEPIHVKKRGLCRRHYHAAWVTGSLEGVTIWRHSITSYDPETMTGDCSTCGPDAAVYERRDRICCVRSRRQSGTKAKHGIDQDTLDRLLEEAGHACPICAVAFGDDDPYCVDHDHACCPGKKSCGACVRGVLCRRCNVGIGMLGDEAERVLAAYAYLVNSSGKNVSGIEKLSITLNGSKVQKIAHYLNPRKTL